MKRFQTGCYTNNEKYEIQRCISISRTCPKRSLLLYFVFLSLTEIQKEFYRNQIIHHISKLWWIMNNKNMLVGKSLADRCRVFWKNESTQVIHYLIFFPTYVSYLYVEFFYEQNPSDQPWLWIFVREEILNGCVVTKTDNFCPHQVRF